MNRIWIFETPIEVDCIEHAVNCLINDGPQCVVYLEYEKDPNTPPWTPNFVPRPRDRNMILPGSH